MRLLLPLALLLAGSPAMAHTPSPAPQQPLTLERLFASPSLSGPTPRLLRLSPDGRLATLLRNRPDDRDRYDLWGVDTATGEARMLVDSSRVGSGAVLSEEEMMRRERARRSGGGGRVDYAWAPAGSAIPAPIAGDLFLAGPPGQGRRVTHAPRAGAAGP